MREISSIDIDFIKNVDFVSLSSYTHSGHFELKICLCA